ncbi:MAG: phosphoribosylanthranilate isomerase [Bacteroidetes bacterium]|nr:phosphoribosylanthranilate isomerase [Bacteroidota bacterium]
MNIKVDGITQLKQLKQLDALDIDFVGFHFSINSAFFMGKTIMPDELQDVDFDIKKTGVFVNQDYEEIMNLATAYELDVIQLHGEEPVALCKKLSKEFEVIKTFHLVNDAKDLDERIKPYDEVCDYYLFNRYVEGKNNEDAGKKFEWLSLNDYRIEKPFFLAGYISLEEAPQLKKFDHPDFYGIDINHEFELSPGEKDLVKILMFKKMLN